MGVETLHETVEVFWLDEAQRALAHIATLAGDRDDEKLSLEILQVMSHLERIRPRLYRKVALDSGRDG